MKTSPKNDDNKKVVPVSTNSKTHTENIKKRSDLGKPNVEQQTQDKKRHTTKLGRIFDRFSKKVTVITGSPWAFILAFFIIIIWCISGPIFNYSDTWQLVINTGTTIVTFLMVFVIQQSQNKDTMALQLKLNELIAASEKASNRLIDVEDLTEEELVMIKRYYIQLSDISKKEKELQCSHSIEEMETSEIEQEIEKGEAENKKLDS